MGEFVPIIFLMAMAALLAAAIVIISSVVHGKKRAETDFSPFECGLDQAKERGRPVSINFFVIAILFLILDVEVALLYPWAATFRNFVNAGTGTIVFLQGALFILILMIAIFYIFRAGAFEWGRKNVTSNS